MTRYKLDPDLAQKVAASAIELIRNVVLEHLTKLEPGTPLVIAYRQENDPISDFQAVGFLTPFNLDDKNIVLENGINFIPRGIHADNYTKIEIPTEYFLDYNTLKGTKGSF